MTTERTPNADTSDEAYQQALAGEVKAEQAVKRPELAGSESPPRYAR